MNIDEKLTLLLAVEESGFNVKESLKTLCEHFVDFGCYHSENIKLD